MIESNNFFTDFVWKYKTPILGVALLLPIAIESLTLVYQSFKDKTLKEGWNCFKAKVIEPFKMKEGESKLEYGARLALLTAKIAFVSFAIVSLVAAPYIVLPGSTAIFIALAAISIISAIYLQRKDIAAMPSRFWQWLTVPYARIEGESNEIYRTRCVKHTLKVILYVGGAMTVLALTGFIAGTFLGNIAGGMDVWSASQTIPLINSVGFTVALYATLGLLHLKNAYQAAKEKSYGTALFYLVTGLLTAFAPLLGQLTNPSEAIRIHHTAIGAAIMLLPSRPLKFLGALIAFDGFSYFLSPARGYETWWGGFNWWDFQNLLLENIYAFAAAYSFSYLLETIHKKISGEKQLEKKEEEKQLEKQSQITLAKASNDLARST